MKSKYKKVKKLLLLSIIILISGNVFSLAAVVHGTSQLQSITSQLNGSLWDYTVCVTGESGPTGIIENIPAGFSYQSSNLPEYQTIINNTEILFSLPDGGNLIFTITGSKNAEGLLTGSCTDLLTGITVPLSPLFLSDGTITTRELDHSVPSEPGQQKTEAPGFGWIITIIALLSLAGSVTYRREK